MEIPIEQHDCPHEGCGITFWTTEAYVVRRRADKHKFYCPNGHILMYKGETDSQIAARLRVEKSSLELENAELTRRLNKAKHPKKKTRK